MSENGQEGTLPTWSIVCTCSEPRRVVEAFVAHHISIGVEQIFLFLDDPFDVTAVELSSSPLVTVILCDDDHWSQRKGGRPADHRLRQTYNAHFAARKLCKSAWLAHIDADEFIYPRGGDSVAELLAQVPHQFDAARVLPAERMFVAPYVDGAVSFEGTFKLKPPSGAKFGMALYGKDLGRLFPHGFQGHEVGKSFLRCSNRDTRFNIHFVRKDGLDIPHYKFEESELILLHFFPTSFEDWKWKYERRTLNLAYFDSMPDHAKARYAIYLGEREDGGDLAIRALFERLCVVSPTTASELEKDGKAISVELKVGDSISQFLPKARETGRGFEHVFHSFNQPSEQRFFQIGMNRCGTKEICSRFAARGYSYAHWDGGSLARDLAQAKRANAKPFLLYGGVNLISDISFTSPEACYDGAYDVEYIANYYPDAIYIINHRPLSEWISSREKFRSGRYLELYRASLNFRSYDEVKAYWSDEWKQHSARVENLARNGLKIVEWKINVDKPQLAFEEIERMISL